MDFPQVWHSKSLPFSIIHIAYAMFLIILKVFLKKFLCGFLIYYSVLTVSGRSMHIVLYSTFLTASILTCEVVPFYYKLTALRTYTDSQIIIAHRTKFLYEFKEFLFYCFTCVTEFISQFLI